MDLPDQPAALIKYLAGTTCMGAQFLIYGYLYIRSTRCLSRTHISRKIISFYITGAAAVYIHRSGCSADPYIRCTTEVDLQVIKFYITLELAGAG